MIFRGIDHVDTNPGRVRACVCIVLWYGKNEMRVACVWREICGYWGEGGGGIWEWSYGVMVSTLDSESSDPGSNPGRTSLCETLLVFFIPNISKSTHHSWLFTFETWRTTSTIYLWKLMFRGMISMGHNRLTLKWCGCDVPLGDAGSNEWVDMV